MSRFVMPATTLVLPLLLAFALACGIAAPVQPVNPPPAPNTAAKAEPNILPASFFLKVSSPENEAVVSVSPLPVQGQTTTDAVATVNGQVVEIDAQGQFITQVNLEEGPNAIEVLVSDFEGHQQAQTLTVIYIPQAGY
jgi:hypothetical protein